LRRSVFEIGYRYVLPSVKRRLVELMLREYGCSQKEVAVLLGLSESAVSRYIASQRGYLVSVEEFKDIDRRIRGLAEVIATRRLTDKHAIYRSLYEVVLEVMAKKYICQIHKDVDEGVDPTKCNICPELFSRTIGGGAC